MEDSYFKNNIVRFGYLGGYMFACEIAGEGQISHKIPQKPLYHIIMVILSGNIEIVINGERKHYGSNLFLNIPLWYEISEFRFSKDFHAFTAGADKSVMLDIFRNRNPFPPSFRMQIHVGEYSLTISKDSCYALVCDIVRLIDSLNGTGHHFYMEINYAYYYILITDIANLLWHEFGEGNPPHNPDLSRKESILKDFMELLNKNVASESRVKFYADSLCISKQHLSSIVNEKIQMPIGKFIALMRIEKATVLLRDPQLSIQQIASKLSFPDQSSFGKFFKKHIGVSPLQYRRNLQKNLLTQRLEASEYSE